MSRMNVPPLNASIGHIVRLAIECESGSIKAGNVHPHASFQNMTHLHFVESATVIGACIDDNIDSSVGEIVLKCVLGMLDEVSVNTCLGSILLLVPMVVAQRRLDTKLYPSESDLASNAFGSLQRAVSRALSELTSSDAAQIYEAIVRANPGGVNTSDKLDVRGKPPDSILDAMRIAAAWDDVALQYVTGFELVFQYADRLRLALAEPLKISDAVRRLQIEVLAERVDSLIVRKQGRDHASKIKDLAQAVLSSGEYGDPNYEVAWNSLDDQLRDPKNRNNPGTTADMLAAAIFVEQITKRSECLVYPEPL